MILFVYFVSISAFSGIRGAQVSSSHSEEPNYAAQLEVSSRDIPDQVDLSLPVNNDISNLKDSGSHTGKLVFDFFRKEEDYINKKLGNLNDDVRNETAEAMQNSINVIENKSIDVINGTLSKLLNYANASVSKGTLESLGVAGENVIEGGLKILHYANGTIKKLSSSANGFLNGDKEIVSNATQNLIKKGWNTSIKGSLSAELVKDAVQGESNILNTYTKDIASELTDHLKSIIIETGKRAFNDIKASVNSIKSVVKNEDSRIASSSLEIGAEYNQSSSKP